MLVGKNEVSAAKERLVALRKEFGPRREVLGIEGWFALGTNDFATAADRFGELLKDQRNTELMILYTRSLWGAGTACRGYRENARLAERAAR